ncbi:hypothetical protein BABINDRAFT_159429 [Babjeviella inositovora NRRL Y-12698]|uniref:Uncharacterized protein n=1 Tax=Babjeviella inositovora NRRL Y-12698 TaxID=984486 RepID=A0A1E3QZ43_9ASCO|nr:uncharacterized protein BABINDRAFT_159429 [Babjeviella inositovora NRRL Y-12698]ODQ82949.1 hypothetical protein BABINDRAFT_159429 [Babjeviella inositovora NRRL Y-12698]
MRGTIRGKDKNTFLQVYTAPQSNYRHILCLKHIFKASPYFKPDLANCMMANISTILEPLSHPLFTVQDTAPPSPPLHFYHMRFCSSASTR